MASTDEFNVEAILGKKGSGAKTKYLIKWQGFGDDENTWELAANLREDGLGSSITKYEKAKPKTPSRSRAKSPAARMSLTPAKSAKKTPAKSAKKSPARKAKKSARKKSPAPKRVTSPARAKSPKAVSPLAAADDDDDEPSAEDVAEAVRAVEELTDQADAAKADGAGGPVSYAAMELPASVAWLAGFMLAVLVAVVLRLTNDGTSTAVAHLQLFFELVPPALCLVAVWSGENDDYSDKVAAVLPWMMALPALENLRRIMEDSASATLTTAFLLALVFFFGAMATIHKNNDTPTFLLALPVLAAGASVNYFKDLVEVAEPGLTQEFLDQLLLGAALCFAWIALFRSVAHLAEAANPMASAALSRWVILTAVLLSFTMLPFALLGVLGKMPLEGPASDFEVGGVVVKATADLSVVVTYYALRWLSALAFVVSVKVYQTKE